MSEGYVYILSNPSMPGLVKIGRTSRDPEQRAVELYQTGVPAPFKVEAAVFAPDCVELETAVHREVWENRHDNRREFFRLDIEEAKRTLIGIHYCYVEELLSRFAPDHDLVHKSLGSRDLPRDTIIFGPAGGGA